MAETWRRAGVFSRVGSNTVGSGMHELASSAMQTSSQFDTSTTTATYPGSDRQVDGTTFLTLGKGDADRGHIDNPSPAWGMMHHLPLV